MNVFVLAWRNVWRNGRRSVVTIGAMTLALWAELLYSGLVAGMIVDMVGDVTEYELGDVQIFTEKYLDRPSLHETIHDHRAILERLDAAGYASTARLYSGGLAASGEFSAGVGFVGLDPARDAGVLKIDQAVAEGRWLDNADPRGVVVGRGLARTLGLKLGSELVVLSQAADGSLANDLYTVNGILLSVASSTDRSTVFLTEQTFRELFAFPDGAHRIIVRKPADAELGAATAAIAALAPGEEVKSWKELNPFIAQMVDAVQIQMTIVYFVMYVAVAILILNAMLMAVFERIREFGVLKAIGYGPGQVLTMMIAEGMYQAGVAAVCGIVLAAPFMVYLQVYGVDIGRLGGVSMMGLTMPTVWHGHYTFENVRVPILMLFGIVFAAVLYPATRAAWIRPVEAMHHQ